MKLITHGAGSYLYETNDGKVEDDFFVCKHCQQGMLMSAWKTRGGFCSHCEGKICYNCHTRTAKFGCEPYIAKLEAAVNGEYRREQNAKILGI